MGAALLDNRQIGDDGRSSGRQFPDLRLAAERDEDIRRERLAGVWSEVDARIREATRSLKRGHRSAPNERAHRYRDDRRRLPPVADIRLADSTGMLVIAGLLEIRARQPFGRLQIVPVTQITARAVRIYARWLRRFGHRRFSVAVE